MLVLVKRFTREKILELMEDLALQDIPDNIEGNVSVNWDKEGGIEVYFIEKSNSSC